MTELVNVRLDDWAVPWYGPPVAPQRLEFYLDGEFVADFGFGNGFVTRTYGRFYSQPASAEELDRLSELVTPVGR